MPCQTGRVRWCSRACHLLFPACAAAFIADTLAPAFLPAQTTRACLQGQIFHRSDGLEQSPVELAHHRSGRLYRGSVGKSSFLAPALSMLALSVAIGARRKRRSDNCASIGLAGKVACSAEFQESADFKEADGIPKTPSERALSVNLQPDYYGSFAEIGAGQEVSRWFLRVGAAAGTVGRSVSAYDMQMSDRMYGKAQRYVTKDRMFQMMQQEYTEIEETLRSVKGEDCRFFSFASTIAAKAFMSDRECEGWLGLMYQKVAGQRPSVVWAHARMTDPTALLQGDALGILGANLVYLCMDADRPAETIVKHLLDDISGGRLSLNWVDFSGPGWANVDNRIIALTLVQYGISEAVVFEPSNDGMTPVVPNLLFYKRPVVVQRGRFRFISKTNEAIHKSSLRQITAATKKVADKKPLPLLELTLDPLGSSDKAMLTPLSPEVKNDFVSRFNVLSSMRLPIMVSGVGAMHKLAEYVRRYTQQKLVIAVGGGQYSIERGVFRETEAEGLTGGLLEAFGKLFAQGAQLYVFPNISPEGELASGVTSTATDIGKKTLLEHLVATGKIVPIEDEHIDGAVREPKTNQPFRWEVQDVLNKICTLDGSWKDLVPRKVVDIVESKGISSVLSSMECDADGGAKKTSPLEQLAWEFKNG